MNVHKEYQHEENMCRTNKGTAGWMLDRRKIGRPEPEPDAKIRAQRHAVEVRRQQCRTEISTVDFETRAVFALTRTSKRRRRNKAPDVRQQHVE